MDNLSFIGSIAKDRFDGSEVQHGTVEEQEVIDFELATLDELHRDNDIECLLTEMNEMAAMDIKSMLTMNHE